MRIRETVARAAAQACRCVGLLAALVATAAAAPLTWSPPQRIPDYTNRTWPPHLIADRNRTVHAFASHWTDAPVAITYRQWSAAGGWTKPIEILTSPLRREATVEGVALDRRGTVHLVFVGGDDVAARIYYSRARLAAAHRPAAWSRPVVIGPDALMPRAVRLAGDGGDNLIALYSGRHPQAGLYAVASGDAGDTWSEPAAAETFGDEQLRVWGLEMLAARDDGLHAVWGIVNQRGHHIAGRYARRSFAAAAWSPPIDIDAVNTAPGDVGPAVPAVAESDGQLLLLYNRAAAATQGPVVHWLRTSRDGGAEWAAPSRPFPRHIGRNGRVAFATDGDDALHLFFGQRVPRPDAADVHGMWHSRWSTDHWSDPEAIVSGPRRADFDPYEARAVISQGNLALVTWMTDPGLDERGTWYSFATLAAAPLPLQPLAADLPPALIAVAVAAAAIALAAASVHRLRRRRPTAARRAAAARGAGA